MKKSIFVLFAILWSLWIWSSFAQNQQMSDEEGQKMIEEMRKEEQKVTRDEIVIWELYRLYEWFSDIIERLDEIPQDKYMIALELVRDYTIWYRKKITSKAYSQSLEWEINSIESWMIYVRAKNASIARDYLLCEKIVSKIPGYWNISRHIFLGKYIGQTNWWKEVYCKTQEATQENNIAICKKIENEYSQDDCRIEYIKIHGTVSDCSQILFDWSKKISCIKHFADQWYMDPSTCVDILIEDGDFVMSCLKNLARNTTMRDIWWDCPKGDKNCEIELARRVQNSPQYIEWLTEEICISAKNDDVAAKCVKYIKNPKKDYSTPQEKQYTLNWEIKDEAINSKNAELCWNISSDFSHIQAADREICVKDVAKINNDPNTCKVLESFLPPMSPENCLYDTTLQYAISQKNIEICKQYIYKENRIADCLKTANYSIIHFEIESAQKNELDLSICDWIDNEERKDNCLISIMRKNESRDDCERLSQSIYTEHYAICTTNKELSE